MTSPLSDEQLASLLAAVPLAAQQRGQPVRVNLRPGLPDDYAGPVELADLRLQLSPWHWLRAEVAHTPRSRQLADEVAAAGFDTVAEAGDLVVENAEYFYHGDPDYWGMEGTLTAMADSGEAHFLPPALTLTDVVAWFETDGVTALQVGWDQPGATAPGPLHVLGNAPGRGFGQNATDWFWSAGTLLLTDPATGERAELTVAPLDDETEAEQEEAEEDPTMWRGQPPQPGASPAPAWLAAGLHYADHCLHRADTGQELTLRGYTN